MTNVNDNLQSIYAEEFMFFFMRFQKCHCRHMVSRIKRKYPSETTEKLAKHVVNAQVLLSFTAGALFNIPSRMATGNKVLRIIGIAGGSVILSNMHISLILKIALLFGKDIDDKARVPEILAVIAATVPAVLLSGYNRSSSDNTGIVNFVTSGAAGAATAYLIGKAAIKYYSKDKKKKLNSK